MKVFLICPVRGKDEAEYEDLVAELETINYEVHWPPRDTDQVDDHGLRICSDNLQAIKEADEVHFVWDGKSQGSLFDLGMAFALDKKVVVQQIPDLTPHKSFQNMVTEWSKK